MCKDSSMIGYGYLCGIRNAGMVKGPYSPLRAGLDSVHFIMSVYRYQPLLGIIKFKTDQIGRR